MTLLGPRRGIEPRYSALGEETAQAVRRAARLISATAPLKPTDIDDIEVRRSIAEETQASRSSIRAVAAMRALTIVLATAVTVLGVVAALGHMMQRAELTRLGVPGIDPVRWWPAACFVVIGATTAAHAVRPSRRTRRASLAAGIASALVAAANIL